MSGYQEMSASGTGNIQEEKKPSEVVNTCNVFSAVSTGKETRYFCLEGILNFWCVLSWKWNGRTSLD